jgi:hypothetical protein
VDAGVHHLQGKAEAVTPAELQSLIREFYLERVALLQRHEGVARHVPGYDANNAYQYLIAREQTHLSWLQHALLDLGAAIPPDPPPPAVQVSGTGESAARQLAAEDARFAGAFVERWSTRVDEVTHARHRGMLKVILGETREHQRFFEQAAEGRTDLLGTSLAVNPHPGSVLPDRWIE